MYERLLLELLLRSSSTCSPLKFGATFSIYLRAAVWSETSQKPLSKNIPLSSSNDQTSSKLFHLYLGIELMKNIVNEEITSLFFPTPIEKTNLRCIEQSLLAGTGGLPSYYLVQTKELLNFNVRVTRNLLWDQTSRTSNVMVINQRKVKLLFETLKVQQIAVWIWILIKAKPYNNCRLKTLS